ncbi:CorA metal ion transporter [Terramyces sp. JEL0728]|nr:CorA metal ion transporter [Terramyces sp. JEL0728]
MSTPVKRENSGSEKGDEVVNDPNAAAAIAFSQPQRPKFQISRPSLTPLDRRFSMITPVHASNSPDKILPSFYEYEKRPTSGSNPTSSVEEGFPPFKTGQARSSPPSDNLESHMAYGSLMSDSNFPQNFQSEEPLVEFEQPEPALEKLDLESIASYFENTKGIKYQSTSSLAGPPRYTFYSEQTGVIRASSFSTLDLSNDDITIREVLESGPFWIDCLSPTLFEMNEISKLFHLHPLTNEDIQTADTREKCEVFEKYFFVVMRSFEQDQYKNSFMQPITVSIVIFRECILSFQFSPTYHSRNVRARIDQLSAYGLHVTTEWINYALIDDITDSYMPFMKVIELEVDTIEELVLILCQESEQADMLRRIGMVRKRVMQLFRLMCTKADVIKMIINRCLDTSTSNETRFYLEDIHDHVLTMMQNLSHYEKSLARSHSNYLAQISIDITQASNRTSDTVMRMTLLASILVPLNIITGLWGMNVRVPGQDREDLAWFFSIICAMFFLITGTYYLIRRLRLI